MNTIAIDCGASFVKGALISNGKITYSVRIKAPKVHGCESLTAPTQIVALKDAVKSLVDDLIARVEKGSEISVCISNEMHGFILLDESGEPVTDYISWQKEYGKKKLAIDGQSLSGRDVFEKQEFLKDVLNSGIMPRGGLPLCNLWYIAHEKNALEALSEKELKFLTLGDYLIQSLWDVQILTHPTNAAATGLYDLKNNCWNQTLIEEATNHYKLKVEFPLVGEEPVSVNGLIIKPAIGDHQAALLGAGVFDDNQLSFNLGTGAQVAKLVNIPEYSTSWQIQPYFNGKYIKRIPYLPSGRAINVLFRFLKSVYDIADCKLSDEDVWNIITSIANRNYCESENGLRVDLSFFENNASEAIFGTITNISEENFVVEELVEDFLVQMANNFVDAARKILNASNDLITELVFTGGIADKYPLIKEIILNDYIDVAFRSVNDETLRGLDYYARSI